VYSQIYSETEYVTHDLAVTISIRNISRTDTIFATRADCFITKGDFIKNYVNKTIYLKPLETAAIVINEKDKEGGTRANFVFVWKTKKILLNHFSKIL
jgi:hypothetical protein